MSPVTALNRRVPARALLRGPVLAAGAGFAVCLAFLASLIDAIPEHDSWTSVDSPVAHWFAAHRTVPLDSAAIHLGTVTEPVLVAAIGALVAAALWTRGHRREGTLLLVATGLATVVTTVMKAVVARPRPAAPFNLQPETQPSFPSGHVLVLGTVVLMAVVLAWPALNRTRRIVTAVGASALVAVVCLDRLIVDAHWLTDVLASLTITLLIVASVLIVDRGFSRYCASRPRRRSRS